MRKYSLSSLFDIQLFGEGSGGAGAAGGGEGGASGAAPAGQESAVFAQPQKGKTNPLAEVQYGLPDEEEAPVAQEQQEAAPADRAAQFEKLIKGEYKDLYEQRIKDTISKRLKGNEEKVKRLDAMSPVLELMAKSYGVDASDTEALKVLTDKAAIAALHTRALDCRAGLSLFDCVLMRQVYRLKYAKKKEG